MGKGEYKQTFLKDVHAGKLAYEVHTSLVREPSNGGSLFLLNYYANITSYAY